MTRTWMVLTGLAVSLIAAPAPATADAAKLRLGAGPVPVGADGKARVALTNPNGKAARGRLTMESEGTTVGTARFRIPARKTRRVRVDLTAAGIGALRIFGVLPVRATATARGAGRTRRALNLTPAAGTGVAPALGGGETPVPSGGEATADGPVAREGRYQGRYAENNVTLAFNVAGGRLSTGPFDGFYLSATCRNVNPGYTGPDQVYTNASAIDPVEAPIAEDGTFAGEGLHHTGVTPPMSWRITGRVTGDIIAGEFSAEYTDAYGNPCSGLTRFTARWYGDYTL